MGLRPGEPRASPAVYVASALLIALAAPSIAIAPSDPGSSPPTSHNIPRLVHTTMGIFPESPVPGVAWAYDGEGKLIFPEVDDAGRAGAPAPGRMRPVREDTAPRSSSLGPIKITEYAVSTNPDTLEADSKGNIWFSMWSQKIGVHYLSNDSVRLIPVPTSGSVDGIGIDENDDVWAAVYNTKELLVYRSATGLWEGPWKPSFGQSVAIPRSDGSNDRVWFTDHPGNLIGEFDRTNKTFKQHAITTPNVWAVDPEIDASGNVWFTAYYDHSIMMLDAKSGVFTTYKTTKNPSSPAFAQFNKARTMFYVSGWSDYVGQFDMGSKTFTGEWTIAGQPSGMGYDPGGFIWYALNTANKIGLVYPSNGSTLDEPVPTGGAGMKDGGYTDLNHPGTFWFSETQASKIGKAEFGGGGGGAVVTRVEVAPAGANITADQTQQFVATAYDQNNQQMNATFTWSATGGSVSAAGLYTPQATGTFTVTATAGGVMGNAQVTVTHGAAAQVRVTPATVTITADQTMKFSAEAVDGKGNPWPLPSPTWSVAAGGSGSIDSTGLYRPEKVGTWTIEALDAGSGIRGSAQVTVTPGAVATVTVTPPTASLTADETQQFDAAAADAKGNPVTTSFAWTAQGGNVSGGLYSPTKVGTWPVTATAGGKSGGASVEVSPGALARIAIAPTTPTITADQTLQFSAKGYDSEGNERPLAISWSVDAGSGGTISTAGMFEPVKVGSWSVKAKEGAVEGTAKVTVTPGKLATLKMEPASATLDKGQRVAFTLALEDAKRNAVTAETTTWEVSGDDLGPFDKGAATLTAKNAGEATVKVTVEAAGVAKSQESRVLVRGGLFDTKGGGQLYYVLSALILVVSALAALAALLARKRRRDRAAQQAIAYQSQPQWPQPQWAPQEWAPPPQSGYEPGPPPDRPW